MFLIAWFAIGGAAFLLALVTLRTQEVSEVLAWFVIAGSLLLVVCSLLMRVSSRGEMKWRYVEVEANGTVQHSADQVWAYLWNKPPESVVDPASGDRKTELRGFYVPETPDGVGKQQVSYVVDENEVVQAVVSEVTVVELGRVLETRIVNGAPRWVRHELVATDDGCIVSCIACAGIPRWNRIAIKKWSSAQRTSMTGFIANLDRDVAEFLGAVAAN